MDNLNTPESNIGHNKDNEKIPKSMSIVNVDSKTEFPLKKTKKILSAIYLITDFYDDREPLKWELRTKTLVLESLLVSFFGEQKAKNKEIVMRDLFGIITAVLTRLDLSLRANLLSHMNFSILKSELESLWDVVHILITEVELGDYVKFPENHFFIEESTKYKDDFDKRHHKGHLSDIKMSFTHGFLNTSSGQLKEKKIDTNHFKNQRRDSILQFLKVKGPSTIRDLSDIVSGVSEKTIQRELGGLIIEGRVKREGERRWSRYIAL